MRKFEAVINKYDPVKYGATLPGGTFYTHKNLLKDNETGKYFAPDETVGFYRYLNDDAHPIGDNYVPNEDMNIDRQAVVIQLFLCLLVLWVAYFARTISATTSIGMTT